MKPQICTQMLFDLPPSLGVGLGST